MQRMVGSWRSVVCWSLMMVCVFAGQVTAQTTTPVPTFVVTSSVTGSGFIDPSAAVIDQGSGKIFRFIPAAGQIISDVTLDGASVMSQVTISSSTGYGTFRLENVQAGHTITATFITDPTPPSTITATVQGNGAVEPAVYELKNGRTKIFRFTAVPGHILSDVTVDGSSVMADVKLTSEGEKGSYTFNYSVGNHTIRGTFIVNPTPPSMITATATGNGIVEPTTYELKVGKSKTFRFTATPGHILSDVRIDDASVMSSVKLTSEGAKGSYALAYATGNHTIAATFIVDPTPAATVNVTATGSGVVEPATYLLKAEKTKTFRFTATPGNIVQNVTLNGTSVMSAVKLTNDGEKGSYVMTYAPGTHTIAVTFATDPTPPSAVTCTWSGQGIVDPAAFTLNEGKTKTLTIIPVTGHQIQDVRVNDASVLGQVTITSSGKGTLKLNYSPTPQTVAVTFAQKSAAAFAPLNSPTGHNDD